MKFHLNSRVVESDTKSANGSDFLSSDEERGIKTMLNWPVIIAALIALAVVALIFLG